MPASRRGHNRALWDWKRWPWKWNKKEPQETLYCQQHRDCPDNQCCHRANKQCVLRSSDGAAAECGLTKHIKRGRRVEWEKKPGEAGFNTYCRELLTRAQLPRTLSCSRETQDRWYQETVKWLVSPRTPIQHLLVCHQLGTGKTITMLRILDAYWTDTRPRLLLFPTETVAENFYRELATKPNRYRTWLQQQEDLPAWPELSVDEKVTPESMIALEDERQQYVRVARKKLATWPVGKGTWKGTGLPGLLRTFSYEQGGNETLARDPLVRWPNNKDRGAGGGEKLQLMDNMIILCDEAHNLLWPQHGNVKDIDLCRRRLHNAQDSLIVYMTATPVMHGETAMRDAKSMMRLVKGVEFAAHNDEGFVSWYMDRPTSLFARIPPAQKQEATDDNLAIPLTSKREPHSRLPNVFAVRIDTYLTRNLWKSYVKNRFQQGASKKQGHRKKLLHTDADGFFEKRTSTEHPRCLEEPAECDPLWTAHEHLMPDWDRHNWSMETAAESAPKLAAIAQSILDTPLKTLVLLDSRFGTHQLVLLLKQENIKLIFLANTNHLSGTEQKRVRAQNAIRLQAFNSENNRLGDRLRVAIAEAEEYGEGISFMHVRRVIVDPGFGFDVRWAAMEQRIGRALRSCSHDGLPNHMKTLQVDMFVAVHNQMNSYPPTIDLEKLQFIEKEIPQLQKGMDYLRDISIDAAYYAAPPTTTS